LNAGGTARYVGVEAGAEMSTNFPEFPKEERYAPLLAVKYKSDPIMKVKIDLIRFLKRRQYI
jgi:hypothetical protein